MKNLERDRRSERGSAGIKFLGVALGLALIANAGINYIPIAYEAASLREQMDTAVVKGLATSGRLKPEEVVRASLQKAIVENNVPADAFVEVKPGSGMMTAHVIYSKDVSILPFGIYKYKYDFNYVAAPSGYLLKDGKS